MKLAISNIAWPIEQDAEVAGVLNSLGVSGIEVAPTKIWKDLLAVNSSEVEAYRSFWNARGFEIVAAQALLFGRPELTLFDSPETRARTLAYLERVVELCAGLGAKALVFGSPKNRRMGAVSPHDAWLLAIEFFAQLGHVAARAGTCVVIEANPPAYGADFVTHAREAIELVRAVDHPGVQLHLDTGCMALASDPIRETFEAGIRHLRHFHVSEPNLDPPGTSGSIDHPAFAAELRSRNYPGWLSIEMREQQPFSLNQLADTIPCVKRKYYI